MIPLKTTSRCYHQCYSNFSNSQNNIRSFPRVTSSSSPILQGRSCASTTTTATALRNAPPVDVIGTSDALYGTLIALVLAFAASFLQGRRNQDDFRLPDVERKSDSITSSTTTTLSNNLMVVDENNDDPHSNSTHPINENSTASTTTTTFDADSWKEMSRPESYVFYQQKLRSRNESSKQSSAIFKSENAWVVIALLALFVPIFSVEFFFALSRQLICGGDPLNQSDWSEFLCSPAATNLEVDSASIFMKH